MLSSCFDPDCFAKLPVDTPPFVVADPPSNCCVDFAKSNDEDVFLLVEVFVVGGRIFDLNPVFQLEFDVVVASALVEG